LCSALGNCFALICNCFRSQPALVVSQHPSLMERCKRLQIWCKLFIRGEVKTAYRLAKRTPECISSFTQQLQPTVATNSFTQQSQATPGDLVPRSIRGKRRCP